MIERTADDLFKIAFKGRSKPDRHHLLIKDEMPTSLFKTVDISKFEVVNKAGHAVKNCTVSFPSGYAHILKPLATFEVLEPIENCHFYFFRIPHKASKLKFAIKGRDHKAVFFSNVHFRMNIYVRLVHHDCYLTVGDAVHIGGGTIALDNSSLFVGAGALWSDGILIQGTDSHGIVDLDTMEIVNAKHKKITLQRRVWLGRQSKVMKGVTIEEGSVVATGAIVTKDMPKACAIAGVPAKVVKRRVTWSRKQEEIAEWEMEEYRRIRDELDAELAMAPKPPSLLRRVLAFGR